MNDVLKTIEERIPLLPIKQQTVALAILRDPLAASFQSVKELSEQIGVSQATVVRFAQEVTGEGYPELQAALRTYIQGLNSPIERLGVNLGVNSEDDALLMRIFETQQNNLRQTFNPGSIASLKDACRMLLEANRIFTFGSRGTYAVSFYLGHHLNRVLKNTEIVADDDRLADTLCTITAGDAAVIVNLPRYSGRLILAARRIHAAGAKLIVIDTQPGSPLSSCGDCCIYVSNSSNDFHNSLVSAMFVSEMLISIITAKVPQRALDNLNELEPIFQEFGQFRIP